MTAADKAPDLVARLRAYVDDTGEYWLAGLKTDDVLQAADEIEKLTKLLLQMQNAAIDLAQQVKKLESERVEIVKRTIEAAEVAANRVVESIGDSASYDNRDLNCCEGSALAHSAMVCSAIRSLDPLEILRGME